MTIIPYKIIQNPSQNNPPTAAQGFPEGETGAEFVERIVQGLRDAARLGKAWDSWSKAKPFIDLG